MFVPPSPIDILFDYLPLLQKELAVLPKEVLHTEVAVIGAGISGLVTAHELLKLGLKPVIYEASHRIGGRFYTKEFEQLPDKQKPFVELGAMRIAKSSRLFFHYADKLGLTYAVSFPTAGRVNTSILNKNTLYQWPANEPPPQPFRDIKHLWEKFILPLIAPIYQAWEKNNIDTVKQLWQGHILQFVDKSLYQVLLEQSPFLNQEQLENFGALGVGSGGLHAFFQVAFLDILRAIINGYISDFFMITEGMTEFANRLYHLPVNTPTGRLSLADINQLYLNLPVVYLDYNIDTQNPVLIVKDNNNRYHRKEYRAIVFTGSMSAANLINLCNKTESGIYLLTEKVREAVKYSPMIVASKTYICTQTKFWKKQHLPACILTDNLTCATYCFDYPQTEYGVVCLSYTWAEDAMKLHAVEPKDRLIIFKRILSTVSEKFSQLLEPLQGEIINIDWINQKYQNGAFKTLFPGDDRKQKELYFQFQSTLSPEDKGLYLAGDSVSWSASWAEGAFYTAINAVYAVANRLGAKIPAGSPLEQNPNLYDY